MSIKVYEMLRQRPQRAADALLRCLGGRTVLLRLPTNAVSGSDAEQLGAGSPSYEDIAVISRCFSSLTTEAT